MAKSPSKSKTKKEPSLAPLRRASSRRPVPSDPEPLYDRIAKRAYDIYQERVRQGPLDDWLKAEREILDQQHAETPNRREPIVVEQP